MTIQSLYNKEYPCEMYCIPLSERRGMFFGVYKLQLSIINYSYPGSQLQRPAWESNMPHLGLNDSV